METVIFTLFWFVTLTGIIIAGLLGWAITYRPDPIHTRSSEADRCIVQAVRNVKRLREYKAKQRMRRAFCGSESHEAD